MYVVIVWEKNRWNTLLTLSIIYYTARSHQDISFLSSLVIIIILLFFFYFGQQFVCVTVNNLIGISVLAAVKRKTMIVS